jgi:hypothetical protein
MEKFIGPLVLLSTLAGVVFVVLLAIGLVRRIRITGFKKIVLAFMCAGTIVPLAILPLWLWTNQHGSLSAQIRVEDVVEVLWPTSISLMALDSPGPAPWDTVALVYGLSILGNVGAYGVVGLIVSPLYVRLKRRADRG